MEAGTCLGEVQARQVQAGLRPLWEDSPSCGKRKIAHYSKSEKNYYFCFAGTVAFDKPSTF